MAESREEKQQRISQELAHAQPQDYARANALNINALSIGSTENRSGGSLGVPFLLCRLSLLQLATGPHTIHPSSRALSFASL